MPQDKKFLYCYHVRLTKDATVTEKCYGSGVLDPNTGFITLKKAHNHAPDTKLLTTLKIRAKVLGAAESSNAPLNQVFKGATRGEEGSELVAYGNIYKAMQRHRRKGQPPVPSSPEEADQFLTSEMYSDKDFSKFYQGMVSGKDLERALLFAKPGNYSR